MRILAFAALAAALTLPFTSQAQAFAARHGLNSSQYQQAFDRFAGQGYRLTHVDAAATPSGVRYAAIWERGGGGFAARHGMGARSYQSNFDTFTNQGYRPASISATGMGSDAGSFAAIWTRGGGAWTARHGLSGSDYQNLFDRMTAQGYRLTDVEGYATHGGVRYAALFERGGGGRWAARHGLTGSGYQQAFDSYKSQGYGPVEVDCYWTPQGVRYAAIWSQNVGRYVARHGLTGAQYQREFDQHVGAGYRLTHVSACWDGSRLRYAAIWLR